MVDDYLKKLIEDAKKEKIKKAAPPVSPQISSEKISTTINSDSKSSELSKSISSVNSAFSSVPDEVALKDLDSLKRNVDFKKMAPTPSSSESNLGSSPNLKNNSSLPSDSPKGSDASIKNKSDFKYNPDNPFAGLADSSNKDSVDSDSASASDIDSPSDEDSDGSSSENRLSLVEKELEHSAGAEVISAYNDVKIVKVSDYPVPFYTIPVPKPTAVEKSIISTIKEAATRLIAIAPYKIRDETQKRNVYRQRILDILRSASNLNIPERRMNFYADAVVREMVGYGLIDPLITDDRLEEIMIIGVKKPVYVFHRDYDMLATNIEFFNDNEIKDLINRIARQVGRRVDLSSPLLDARLPDGSRVHASIPPASISGSTMTIRKFREDPFSIIDLIKFGTMSSEAAAFLWLSSEGFGTKPANILIAGGTGSGKTSTLNVLASMISPSERVISIEDTAELNLPIKHWIRMEARPPGLEGTGEITLDILTKNSLRMRPDRVIVGEIRHDEAFTLFTAMNTGHDGCIGTVHSNSARETIVRVTSPPMNVPELMMAGLDMVIVQHRLHDRKKGTIRRISEISEVTGVLEGKVEIHPIFERDAFNDSLNRTVVASAFLKKLSQYSGMSMKRIEEELKQRQLFLERLLEKNIHSIQEVSDLCVNFLNNK